MNQTFIFDCSMGDKVHFENESIPFAQFLDVETLQDSHGIFPYTYPNISQVHQKMESFGVKENDTIIWYSQRNKLGNGRAFHILTTYGFQNVKVLNGDLEYWKELGKIYV